MLFGVSKIQKYNKSLKLLPCLLLMFGANSVLMAGDLWVEGYYDESGNYVESHYLFRTNVKQFDNNVYTKADKKAKEANPELYYQLSNAQKHYVKRNSHAKQPNSNFHDIQVPEHARLNYFGTDWECRRGFLRQGDGCIKIHVPENAKLNRDGNGWECLPGYRKSQDESPFLEQSAVKPAVEKQPGQTSKLSCKNIEMPENAKLNMARNDWECDRGYQQIGDSCIKMEIPPNARLNFYGANWECKYGYRQVGKQCREIRIPQHARLNYLGTGWQCEYGYIQDGHACVEVLIPDNAKLNYTGTGWNCKHGYIKLGEQCTKIEVPSHARLNFLGNGWDCVRGYRKQGARCVEI